MRSFLAKRQAGQALQGVGIAPSFIGERNLPNMSKITLDFLICQGEEHEAKGALRLRSVPQGGT